VLGSRPKSGSFSSSGRSESSVGGGGTGGASSGNELEEGEVKARHLLVANHGAGSSGQRVLVKIRPPQLPTRHCEGSCSTDGRQSSEEEDEDDDDEEEEVGMHSLLLLLLQQLLLTTSCYSISGQRPHSSRHLANNVQYVER